MNAPDACGANKIRDSAVLDTAPCDGDCAGTCCEGKCSLYFCHEPYEPFVVAKNIRLFRMLAKLEIGLCA